MLPICPPVKCNVLSKYTFREINHDPQMKNCKKFITVMRNLMLIYQVYFINSNDNENISIFWLPAVVFNGVFVASHSSTAIHKAASEKTKVKSEDALYV